MIERIFFIIFLHRLRTSFIKNGYYFVLPDESSPKYRHINNGFCGLFSGRICERYPEAKENYIKIKGSYHYCVRWRNRYYDSECVFGTNKIENLPICKEFYQHLHK